MPNDTHIDSYSMVLLDGTGTDGEKEEEEETFPTREFETVKQFFLVFIVIYADKPSRALTEN